MLSHSNICRIFNRVEEYNNLHTYFYCSNDIRFTWLTIINQLVNFAITFIYGLLLGVSLNIYERQLRHIEFFSLIFSQEQAQPNDLPTLPLRKIKNIVGWLKIRQYIKVQLGTSSAVFTLNKGHQFLPLLSGDIIFRWALIFLILLWVSFILVELEVQYLNMVASFILLHIVITAIFIIAAIGIGSQINSWQHKHVILLYKEKVCSNDSLGIF